MQGSFLLAKDSFEKIKYLGGKKAIYWDPFSNDFKLKSRIKLTFHKFFILFIYIKVCFKFFIFLDKLKVNNFFSLHNLLPVKRFLCISIMNMSGLYLFISAQFCQKRSSCNRKFLINFSPSFVKY